MKHDFVKLRERLDEEVNRIADLFVGAKIVPGLVEEVRNRFQVTVDALLAWNQIPSSVLRLRVEIGVAPYDHQMQCNFVAEGFAAEEYAMCLQEPVPEPVRKPVLREFDPLWGG